MTGRGPATTSIDTAMTMGSLTTMNDVDTATRTRSLPACLAAVAVALCLAGVGLLAVAAPAHAVFGDSFGFSPLNDGAGPAQEAPAMPEARHAFWAGTCDRGGAPAPGVAIPDGIGTYSATTSSPDPFFGISPRYVSVPAPATAAHCIEWGIPAPIVQSPATSTVPWSQPPSWRLAAHSQAGGHPDGTSNFALNRVDPTGNTIDGTLDNIVVDLPPGFVGDPTAVTKCTAEQFGQTPLLCPPESQVGVLQLEIQAVFGAENVPSGNERIYPVYNLEPRRGNAAELGFGYASGEDAVNVRIVAKARTNSDFGVTAFVGQIPAALQVRSQQITLWGIPWAASNDVWRAPLALKPGPSNGCRAQAGLTGETRLYLPPSGFTAPGCAQSYQPSWGPIKPFLSNLTECTGGGLSTRIAVDEFQQPGPYTPERDPAIAPYPAVEDEVQPQGSVANPTTWRTYSSPAPAMQRCSAVPFAAQMDLQPTTAAAGSASGLSVDLGIAQNDDSPFGPPAVGSPESVVDGYVADAAAHWKSDAGLATSHLDKAVVSLPEGFSVNPSAASGLDGCSDAEIGVRQQGNPPLFNNGDPFNSDPSDGAECPQASIIGEVFVDVPLLEEPLRGHVVLGDPKSTDPASGEMFRMFIVVKDVERGVIAKVYGSATADPASGRLTATFDENPRVPFEAMRLDFKQGAHGVLATPQRCASHGWASTFTPWTAAHGAGGQSVQAGGAMTTSENCGFGFAPALAAGMDTQAARAHGTFSFRFARSDGEQYLRGLTTTLPRGLLASVKDLPLCTDAQAGAGACPASSKIGLVDAKAGAGDPFVLEEKGELFLTEGYKGGQYGLAVKIRPIAGPFRGAMELSPIMVRQAIHVDRKTAQVTAISDPFPLIHHGVPLRVREVTVLVNRGGFMLNPSDCAQKQIDATLVSEQGVNAGVSNAFHASGCQRLAFKPKLALRLTGRKQVKTGKHPGIRATVTQKGVPEAGIEKAEVRLPKSLALDVDNAQALCEFETGTKPDLENHCPKGSIVGRARAVSPLLNDPLVGNVYFVKNVRRSSSGNLIRTLPMIIVALRGEIAVNLTGESNVKKGKLVNTFDNVPDAPISRFNLNINGGKNGILAVTRTRRGLINLCARPKSHIAEADMDGQNGRRHDRDIRMKTPCAKKSKKTKAQRRKAAAKRRAVANQRKGGRGR
jgi:hypothetical protein